MHTPYKKYLNKAFILLMGLGLVNQQLQAQETYPKLDQTQVQGTANRTVSLPSSTFITAFNATRTYSPRVRINDSTQVNDNSSPDRVSISTTYSNGLGATIQTVQQNATLSAAGQYKHLVAPNDVRSKADPYGFMPYPSDVKNYNQSGPNHSVMYHNANRYPSESGVADESVISTGQVINSSNLNERSTTAYAAGKSRMGQGRGIKVKAITNKTIGQQNTPAANVRRWTLDASGMPVSSTVYAAGMLAGTVTESADGMEKYVLNDRSGKPVYEAILQTIPGGVKLYAVTYYVYDELDRLRYTIPPKAVAAISVAGWTISQAIIDELCFAYRYDADGRQHSIHKPGEQGYTELVYHKDGHAIMRRSPLERQKGVWELIFSDKSGRVIATGLLSSNSDRAYWQGQADAQTAQASNSPHYYIWGAGKGQHPPKTGLNATEMLTYNYYDKYPATVLASETYDPALFQPHQVYGGTADAPSLRASIYGLLAATEVKVLNNPAAPTYLQNWTSAKTFYDYYGRSIYAVGQNATGAKDSAYHQYNQSGQPIKKWHLRNAVNGGVVKRTTELETFNYEAYSGRLSGIWRSTNGGVNEPAVRYSYDEMGRMTKEVLGNDAETRLYTYNVRGELLGINEDYALTGNKGAYSMTFGEALRYDYGFTFPRYDGMVSGMVWRGSGGMAAKAHSYTYRYDSAGRMTSARYYEAATTGGVPTSWTNTQRNYSQTVAYDQNSNITAATRFGVSQNPSYTGVYQVDQLTYRYQTNSNKLKEVNDAVTIDYRTGDYQPGSLRGYNYDEGGNLTEDKSKKITNVSYTWFNKPQQVTFADGSSILYTYDAGGSKLQEIVANGSQVSYTTYISGAVYKDTTLTYISTAQGRTNMTASPPRQEYFVKDHLDNVRSTVASLYPQTLQYNVGYELTHAPQEEALFENVAEIRGDKPGSTATDDVKAGLLKDDRQTGTSILLKVMAGDKFEINAENFYESIASFSSAQEPNTPAETIFGSAITSLAGGSNAMNSAEGSSSAAIANRMFSNPDAVTAYNSLVDAETDDSRPAAFLNFLFFDDEMKLMPEHSRLWQAAGENNWAQIGTGTNFIEMPQNGYVVVYISNQTQKANWFDNLQISFTKGILLEETHYYAYGLPIVGLSSQAATATKQRHRYQDNEYIQELGLNWMDFHNRAYDPQLGRFLALDALADADGQQVLSPFHAMGCNPVNMIDPLGLAYFAPGEFRPSYGIANAGIHQFADGTTAVLGGTTTFNFDLDYAFYESMVAAIAQEQLGKYDIRNIEQGEILASYNGAVAAERERGRARNQEISKLIAGAVNAQMMPAYLSPDGSPYNANTNWQDLDKPTLRSYAATLCNCSGWQLEQFTGSIFENSWNKAYKTVGEADNYMPNQNKVKGGSRPTIPDGIANGRINRLFFPDIIVKDAAYFEVKAINGTIYNSLNSGQIRGHLTNLAANIPRMYRFYGGANASAASLTFVTTSGVSISKSVHLLAASQNILLYHYTAQYMMTGGSMQIRFQLSTISGISAPYNFVTPSVPLR